jgi:hypothetical protein
MQICSFNASGVEWGAKFRHGGIYGQACSRISHFGAFSGRCISPGLCVAELWVWLRLWSTSLRLRSYSAALRLRGSSIRLRSSSCGTDRCRNDHYYRDACSGATTILFDELLKANAKELIEKAIEMAKGGGGPALRLCSDRLAPARKDWPVWFDPDRCDGATVGWQRIMGEAVCTMALVPATTAMLPVLAWFGPRGAPAFP